MNLLPKDPAFFDLLAEHMNTVCEASGLLRAGLVAGYQGVCERVKQMDALERAGDEVIHKIFHHLQKTFITPFDPEDIQRLATTLDTVLDYLEDVTFRIAAYRLDPIPAEAKRLGEMIDDSNHALSRALKALRENRSVLEDCIEVNRLENEADTVERSLVAKLFSSTMDPITLLKQKEIIELLEQTTDMCEDVADVIQNVAVKNG
jgi:predicted phosphate transport protein (TIGR00153 family)